MGQVWSEGGQSRVTDLPATFSREADVSQGADSAGESSVLQRGARVLAGRGAQGLASGAALRETQPGPLSGGAGRCSAPAHPCPDSSPALPSLMAGSRLSPLCCPRTPLAGPLRRGVREGASTASRTGPRACRSPASAPAPALGLLQRCATRPGRAPQSAEGGTRAPNLA